MDILQKHLIRARASGGDFARSAAVPLWGIRFPGPDRPHGGPPGVRPGRARSAGTHHPGVLGHVDRGDPLMDPLVFLRNSAPIVGSEPFDGVKFLVDFREGGKAVV